jgi:RHS repeat-associated protein
VGGLLWVNNYQTTFDGQTLPTGIHFVAYDGNGNVSALVKASDGSISARYEYGPFAESVRVTGALADAQPIRFSTKWTDQESGFLYYGYRHLNPITGRWISRDPIGELGSVNLYGYLGNDAINALDWLGLLNIVRLGFMGAGETTGKWLMGLNASQIFTSKRQSAAMKYILKQLDTNGDGKVDDCDEEADIRITGYSWGGWTAVQLAREIKDTEKIKSTGNKHRKTRLGLLDPVDTARGGTGSLSPNVYFALDFYQRNGCYKGRCPGPSSWYKGRAITGAANIDMTNVRPSAPQGDGVPVNMTPDHVHMMEDYRGVASIIGTTLWLLPWP